MPNPGLELRLGEGWTPLYDRLCPLEIDRHMGHRARLEDIIAFRAIYARDPEAAVASLRAKFEEEIERAGDPGAASSVQPAA